MALTSFQREREGAGRLAFFSFSRSVSVSFTELMENDFRRDIRYLVLCLT
jgi:hypothetical protein